MTLSHGSKTESISMQSKALLVVLALSLACANADTVYLIGGKKVSGTVEQDEKTVKVTDEAGKVHTFDAVDVLYVAKGSATPPEDDAAGTPGKIELSPGDPSSVEDPLLPPAVKILPRFGIHRATRPEEVVFHLLQMAQADDDGSFGKNLQAEIETWRRAVKDRKRRVGQRWLDPEQIKRLRGNSQDALDKAKETYDKVRRSHRGRRPGQGPRRLEMAPVYKDLREAAWIWPDKTLRDFLVGISYLRQGRFDEAIASFSAMKETSDLLAVAHQGLALSRLERDTPVQALEPAMRLYQLRPDSDEAAELLFRAARAVPGSQRKHPDYLVAKEILDKLGRRVTQGESVTSRPRRRSRETWLLPGRSERAYDYQLPLPVYDRLDFVQAVAVATDEHTLLVDGSYLADALQVYVRIDADTLVPAEIGRSRRDDATPDGLSLIPLRVEGVTFEPLKSQTQAEPIEQGQTLALVALPMFQQMGSVPRVVRFQAKRDEKGSLLVEPQLLPGEAAGPVLTPSGTLAGFLAGRIDPMAPGAGPHVFHDRKSVQDARSSRSPLVPKKFRQRMGGTDDPADPEAVKGRYFLVYAVMGEKM
jgi:tetratricopeptide (TPR) repeat protein